MKVYYFGCIERAGHFFFNRDYGLHYYDAFDEIPWGMKIDGGLLSRDGGQEEGISVLTYQDGWTALSFWDRSVDERKGSNSNLVCDEEKTFDEMIVLFKEHFPGVYKRFNFEVKERTPKEGK